jgi:predicted neuraminidase
MKTKTIMHYKYLLSAFSRNKIAVLIFVLVLGGCSHKGNNHTSSKSGIITNESLPVKGFLFGDNPGFAQSHASTIIHLKNGKFIAAWFGGTKEGADDVGIWMTKGRPGQWEKPFEVAKIRDEPHWNPVLFQSPSGKIFLFFKVGKDTGGWENWIKTSVDKGKTWSDAHELVPDSLKYSPVGPVRNKPIILSNGAWIAGSSNEEGQWNCFFSRSNDQGKTWHQTPYLKLDRKAIKGKGIIQPTLWEYPKGHVHALLRSSEGVIYRSDSKDYGKTWSQAYKTSFLIPIVRLMSSNYRAIHCHWLVIHLVKIGVREEHLF